MGHKLDRLEAYLTGWQSENERISTEYESTEFLRGTMYAVARMKLQIKRLKDDDNRGKIKKV